MTTSIMKMRDYNKGDQPGTKFYDNRVCGGMVVGDSCTRSANYRLF